MTPVLTGVLSRITALVLPVANLVGHAAVFAGVLTILLSGLAAVVLRFAAVAPVVLTFLVLQLALAVRVVAEMLPVMVGRRRRSSVVWGRRRRRFAVVWRRRRSPVVWRRGRFAVVRRRRTRLRDGLHRRPQRENQNGRDRCDLSISHTDLDSSLPQNHGPARRSAMFSASRNERRERVRRKRNSAES